MNGDINLFLICLVAFGLVVILLTLLAGVIYLLTKLFPMPTRSKTDPFVIAAIESSVRARFPSARVTDIQPIESNSASRANHDIH